MFPILLLAAIFISCAHASLSGDFVNDYHEKFVVQCLKGNAVSFFGSEFSRREEDRRWAVKCGQKLPGNPNTHQSYWTNYVNDFQKVLNFHCPPQSVMSGLIGTYSNDLKDRRYRFRCTHMFRYRKGTCFWSHYTNKLSDPLYVSIRDNYFFDGVISFYYKQNKDRYFRFRICRLIENGC